MCTYIFFFENLPYPSPLRSRLPTCQPFPEGSFWGGPLRDISKDSYEGDYHYPSMPTNKTYKQ